MLTVMKPQFLFFFTNKPTIVALDDRARTAKMMKAYRRNPTMYQLKRTAPHSYLLRVTGFVDTVTIHSQEFIS